MGLEHPDITEVNRNGYTDTPRIEKESSIVLDPHEWLKQLKNGHKK